MKTEDLWGKLCPDPFAAQDMESLFSWACDVRPRSVQDVKPLLILVQSLLRDIISGKLDGLMMQISAVHDVYAETLAKLRQQVEDLEKALQTIRTKEEGAGPLKEDVPPRAAVHSRYSTSTSPPSPFL